MNVQRVATSFRYVDIITALFVTILIVSNIASSKITSVGPLTFDAGTILFPLAYILGDVLTEVYGYNRARRVIWIGLFCNVLMAIVFMTVAVLPSAPDWHNQDAYNAILGLTPRIVLASITAYFVGEFLNSFILAKLKVVTQGKHLWMRTIGSSLVGHLFDSILFIAIAFYGVMPMEVLIALVVSNYLFKVAIEVLFTPLTYLIANKLKKVEGVDHYDKKTNFNPFSLETS